MRVCVGGGGERGGVGGRTIPNPNPGFVHVLLTQQNDSCIKMDSGVNQLNFSFIAEEK